MVVARHGDQVIGSAALEVCPEGVLLRSVAVAPEARDRDWPSAIRMAASVSS